MIGQKKLAEVQHELEQLLAKLPPDAQSWLDREIAAAESDPNRDVETLEMVRAALHQSVADKQAVSNHTE